MQSCDNKTLDKFLKHLIEEFERDDSVVNSKNIPFVISVLWQKFSYADKCEIADFIDDLEKYADYIISINKPQNDYSGICDIEISLLKYIKDDYDDYDSPNNNYIINIEYDERLWGYCQCSPEDEDYREDKHCCGHGCDWLAPHLTLNKVFVVASHNWTGDEHDFWNFEDNFYKSELELNEQNKKIEKEKEIQRLNELIEDSKKRLKELMAVK